MLSTDVVLDCRCSLLIRTVITETLSFTITLGKLLIPMCFCHQARQGKQVDLDISGCVTGIVVYPPTHLRPLYGTWARSLCFFNMHPLTLSIILYSGKLSIIVSSNSLFGFSPFGFLDSLFFTNLNVIFCCNVVNRPVGDLRYRKWVKGNQWIAFGGK